MLIRQRAGGLNSGHVSGSHRWLYTCVYLLCCYRYNTKCSVQPAAHAAHHHWLLAHQPLSLSEVSQVRRGHQCCTGEQAILTQSHKLACGTPKKQPQLVCCCAARRRHYSRFNLHLRFISSLALLKVRLRDQIGPCSYRSSFCWGTEICPSALPQAWDSTPTSPTTWWVSTAVAM